MRGVRNKKQVRERLLLDPHARPVELDEQVVARRGGIIDRDEAGDPGALLGLDRFVPGNPTCSYRTRDPLRVTGEITEWKGHLGMANQLITTTSTARQRPPRRSQLRPRVLRT